MSFIDKIKSTFGIGDIAAITKLKNEEADVFKAKEKVIKEELEKNEALQNWSENIELEPLKAAVEEYYEKKKEIIEAFNTFIKKAKKDYLLPLEKIAQKVETLNDLIEEKEKLEKKLEKAKKNFEKKDYELEKEQNKVETQVDKIRKKELDLEKAKTELQKQEKLYSDLTKRVENTRKEVQNFKHGTLKAALTKLNEYENAYLVKANEVFAVRGKVLSAIPGAAIIETPAEEKEEDE